MDERVFVSLGVLKVAASLERAGVPVEVLDLSGVENYEEVARLHAQRTKRRTFGVTATTPQMPAAVKIAHAVQCSSWCRRVILGGPHPTLVNAAARKGNERALVQLRKLCRAFDVVVAGDGEKAIFKAIGDYPPYLIDADDPKGSLFLKGEELDLWPARHLVDMDSYHYTIDGERATSLIAQLGCPFGCNFCGGRLSPMLRRVRMRSTENVVAEMRHLYERYGFKAFMFYDDELNVNKNVVELMHAIAALGKDLGVEWKLRGFVKAELFTDEQAEAMARAGFKWLLVGFESGSPRILENINKHATLDDNNRCLQIARRHGIKIKALMSLGHAGESEKSVRETRDWLLALCPSDFDCTVITTYPGTPYYDEAVETGPGVWTFTAKSGDRLHARDVDFLKEAAYYKGAPGEYESFVWTDYLSAGEIVALRDELERDVRRELHLPYNQGQPGVRYESSIGQLPSSILRRST